jgi:hypothetical protein
MAGCGVRRADRGLLQRAARAAAARAAPGSAAPRQHTAAPPAARARPGRSRIRGRRASTWPAALAPGASPRPPPEPPLESLTGQRPQDSYHHRAPPGRRRKGETTRNHRAEPHGPWHAAGLPGRGPAACLPVASCYRSGARSSGPPATIAQKTPPSRHAPSCPPCASLRQTRPEGRARPAPAMFEGLRTGRGRSVQPLQAPPGTNRCISVSG